MCMCVCVYVSCDMTEKNTIRFRGGEREMRREKREKKNHLNWTVEFSSCFSFESFFFLLSSYFIRGVYYINRIVEKSLAIFSFGLTLKTSKLDKMIGYAFNRKITFI